MEQSLNQIADQILNAVYAGLKGPANFSVSKEQIKDEVAQARNRQAEEVHKTGQFIAEPYRQTIPKLALVKKDFSGVAGYDSQRQEYFAEIPELLFLPLVKPMHYVSVMGKVAPFKIVYGDDFFYTQYDRYSGNKPTVWIKDRELWLLKPPIANISHIGLRGMFENPRALNGVGGIKFTDDDPYPMPTSMIDRVRNKLVNDYIRQYRMANVSPTLLAGDINIQPDKK